MSGQPLPDDEPRPGAEPRLERVGSGRSARGRPAAALVALLAFIGLALAKPWGAPAGSPAATVIAGIPAVPSGSDPIAATGRATPRTSPDSQPGWLVDPPFIPGPRPDVSAAAVRGTLATRDGWGVRAVVESGPALAGRPATLAERWTAVQPDGWGQPGPLDDRPVRALGVTVPAGTLVVDVRVLVQVAGEEHWLDAEPVPGGNPGASVLLWPPRSSAGWEPAWPPGNYRLLVLTRDGITVLGAALSGSGAGLSIPGIGTRLWQGTTEGRQMILGADLPSGLFAGVIPRADPSGVAATSTAGPSRLPGWAAAPALVALGGRTTAALGTASAWLDTVAGQPSAIAASVVNAWLPSAVSIGVAGPVNMVIHGSRLVRLMPGFGTGGGSGADNLAGSIVDLLSSRPYREAIRFDQPQGGAWEPGVYAVFVEGDGSAGNDVFAYVLTLLPGPARQIAAPLAATRAWARFAGGWGVAAGVAEPIDSPGRLAVRFSPQAPEGVVAGGDDYSRRCLEVNLVDGAQPILGISHPYDVQPTTIGIQRVYLDGSVLLPVPAQARSVLPGLSLVGAGEGTAWAPGWYRLLVTAGGATRALPFCVGSVEGGLLAVPPGVGTRGT